MLTVGSSAVNGYDGSYPITIKVSNLNDLFTNWTVVAPQVKIVNMTVIFCHLFYFYVVFVSLLGMLLFRFNVNSMGKKRTEHSSKFLLLFYTEERKSNRFKMTLG